MIWACIYCTVIVIILFYWYSQYRNVIDLLTDCIQDINEQFLLLIIGT